MLPIPQNLRLSLPSVIYAYTAVPVVKHDAVKAHRDSWSYAISIPNPGTWLGIVNEGEQRFYAPKKWCHVSSLASQPQLLSNYGLSVLSSYGMLRVLLTRFIIFTSMNLCTGFWEMEAEACKPKVLHEQLMELVLTCTSTSSARHGERTTLEATRQTVDNVAKSQ
jgi:hypothetical protein